MMKALMIISLIVCCSFAFQKKTPKRSFALGKFSYDLYEESKYSHDDNWNAVFFVVVRHGKTKKSCSAYKVASRNDSTFIKGKYSISNDKIEFDCYYYYDESPVSVDSMKLIFYASENGDLLLQKTMTFKNGKASINEDVTH